MEEKKGNVAVYFSKDEYQILQEAKKYTVLTSANLLKILIKEVIIERYKESKEIEIKVPIGERKDVKIYKSITTQIDVGHDLLNVLSKSAYMSTSNFIKLMIMPELRKMIKEKGREMRI